MARVYLFFFMILVSVNIEAGDCYDSVVEKKIRCALNSLCLDKESIGTMYNLIANTQNFYLAGLDYNTVKLGLERDYEIFRRNFSSISKLEFAKYRCVRNGGKDILIFGMDLSGSPIILNYLFRDGGVVGGARDRSSRIERYFENVEWLDLISPDKIPSP